MNKCIIHPTNEGGVAVVYLIIEIEGPLEEYAEKILPEGSSYKIINVEDVPQDMTFRDAWEYIP